jgi:hypothetical protein
MKTAIYIEDGTVQLVITPESEFEKNAMSMFRDKPLEARLFVGQFYDCRGGWVRQKEYLPQHWNEHRGDESLILRTVIRQGDAVVSGVYEEQA